MNKNIRLVLILCCLSFVIPLAYFIGNETATIYGDDLGFYISHSKDGSFSGLFTNLSNSGKFRPVSAFVNNVNILLFDKNLHNYFLFNVCMQSLIIGAFSFTLNLFLRNVLLSWMLALVAGLSRFAHYNISQVYNGGSLEGLGVFVFIVALYFMLKFMLDEDTAPEGNSRHLWWALFFANVGMYVHERYITVLAFIILLALFYPMKSKPTLKQKATLAAVSVLLILSNYLVKTYVCGFNFFLGTGGDSHMTFDLERMLGFFQDGVLSMVQYNIGEQGWAGLNFVSVPVFHQVLAVVTIVFLLLILVLFFITAPRKAKADQKESEGPKSRHIVVALFVLMIFCLVPAVSTIRLEQRWLQAPLVTLLLILVYAFHNIRSKFRAARGALFAVFVLCFFASDYLYYLSYKKYSYWNGAETTARTFKEAYYSGMIWKKTQTIYILVEERTHFPSSGFLWVLGDGAIFDYYGGGRKKMIIIDFNMFKDKDQLPYIIALNKETEQVIRWDGSYVSDFTDKVLYERGKFLNEHVGQN